ncbi:MAG: sn-glycerol-1-phosphate dehydrogenase [Ruminococcaceae bacterium]|nr:sn-glycerol-1-phosphate dehydrogenase [Oscillospiraceae bacterium]
MTIENLLRGRSDCACGRAHSCNVRHVEIGEGALEQLPRICSGYERIHLVSDGNTYPLCGERVKQLLNGRIVSETRFGCATVVPNEASIAQIEAELAKDSELIVGIGSGVINDLCKHLSQLHGIRYVIVATAPSMDGYASVGAALILNQMKVTVNGCVPLAIVAETEVLCTAPRELLQSGYGDIVGKYSCLCDWRLASLLRNEYFCPFVHDRVMATAKRIEGYADAILAREPRAVNELMEALVEVGVMMSYVGNSRPASGSEHHLSHFFEITGLLHQTPYYLHGIDVLYSSAVTARLRESLLSMQPPFARDVTDLDTRERELREIYGAAADGVIDLQRRVGLYDSLGQEDVASNWREICEVLSDAPSYAETEALVRAIGLDMKEFAAFYGEATLCNAITYAKDLKDRFTVLWIAYLLGIRKLTL